MKVCYYIDDTLVIAASKAECSANVPKYKVLKTPFKTNFKKSQVDPLTQLTYLGFILDSSIMTISLPEEKIENFFKVFSVILTICLAKRLK